ncbi:glycosyltransferase family 2 protein [Vibrio harveyi]
MKKISVIITIYNRQESLEAAIKSYLAQDYEYKELVLVDDGSTDLSSSIAQKYAELDNVIYTYQENRGAAAAKNKGVELATSDYVTFLDSDDVYFDSLTLRKIANNIGDRDFLSFNKVLIRKNKKDFINEYNTTEIESKGIRYHMLKSPLNYAGHNPYVFRKSKFISSGCLDETAKWGDALSFWREFFSSDVESTVLDEVGYVYDQSNPNSVSRNKSADFHLLEFDVIRNAYIRYKNSIKKQDSTKIWELILTIKAFKSQRYGLFFKQVMLWLGGNPIQVVHSLIYVLETKVLRK